MKGFKFIYLFLILIILTCFNNAYSIEIKNYCYVPPIIGQAVSPNILFVIDVSGSMSWRAYGSTYNSSKTYEGYFDPSKNYKKVGGVWEETNDNINVYSGNYLNWLYMRRIDLVRWAITGGKPESCDRLNPNYCDPFLYPNSRLSCDNEGCILETYNGMLVKVPWERLKQALVYKFKQFSLKPRMGVMFFSGWGIRSDKVYIGDFIDSAQIDTDNPYKNLITAINYEDPNGSTPTAPALWDAYNYFSQEQPEYGGFEPQSGENDKWRNPMYQCFDENKDNFCSSSEFKLVPCAKNFIILLTDGQWNTPSCSILTGYEDHSADPVVPAYWLHKKGFTNAKTGRKSYIEAIYGIGLWLGGTGEKSLKNVAMYGSFDTSNNNWPDNLTGYPWKTCYMDDCGWGRGSACTSLPSSSQDWDKDGDGVPDTFFNAQNAQEIKDSIYKAILDILRRTTSGATVATLTGRRNYSSLIIQPYLYPKYQPESGEEVSWIGLLKSFWIDFDANLREDTADPMLWLNISGTDNDTIFQFVSSGNETKAWEISDIKACQTLGEKEIKALKAVVEFGCKLADTSASERKIFVNFNGALQNVNDNSFKNWLFSLWKQVDSSLNHTTLNCIFNYIIGESLDSSCNSSDWVKRPLSFDISEVCNPVNFSGEKRWKLGDIIFSTPTIVSKQPVGIYHLRYHDTTYLDYISSTQYRNRKSYIFVGANDGMLHVFQLGYTVATGDKAKPIRLVDDTTSNSTALIGKEEWAFIPKSMLPYLVWYGHKDYCHIPYVDYRTLIIDASINGDPDDNKTSNSWRTLLIGVTGFGGKAITVNGTTFSSSIFVLDLTDWLNDPENQSPKLLWEKSLPDHTLTLSFPSVIRLGDPAKNGKWYIVIGSGPKDPEGTEFSNATLYFFDLKTGNLEKSIFIKNNSNNIVAAVGDTMPVDVDNDYQDDVIYFGTYTQNSGSFYRLSLKNSSGGYKNIGDLQDSDIKLVIDPQAPIFAAPSFTKDKRGHFWVFLGTGRFLNDNDREPTYKNYLIGLKDSCWNGVCDTSYTFSDLDNKTGSSVYITVTKTEKMCMCDITGCDLKDIVVDGVYNNTISTEPTIGWFHELDNAELIYSQPFIFASTLDAMIYQTSNDICEISGKTYVMALNYKTGLPYSKPAILNVEGQVGQKILLSKKYFIGKGAPPMGQPFQVGAINSSTGRYRKFTQISSGVVVQLNQQAQSGLKGKFILWIEK